MDEVNPKPGRLLIVGADQESNVGGSFLRGAAERGVPAELLNHHLAFTGPALWRKVCWHLLGRRAPRQGWFSGLVLQTVIERGVDRVLFTGQVPIKRRLLEELERRGVRTAVYLTDDPFNRTHRCGWFLGLLPLFDAVFTTRRANLDDLRALGLKRVEYLPFAQDTQLFYPPPAGKEPVQEADVFFAGGADAERARLLGALHQGGLKLSLYGSYWERYPETLGLSGGQCNVAQLREAAWASKVGLCVVRKANRDGHCMRTFELPALRSCMLVEDTDEHRELFGADGEVVVYFKTIPEMVEKATWLRDRADERERLAKAAHDLIAHGHAYADRLQAILKVLGEARSDSRS